MENKKSFNEKFVLPVITIITKICLRPLVKPLAAIILDLNVVVENVDKMMTDEKRLELREFFDKHDPTLSLIGSLLPAPADDAWDKFKHMSEEVYTTKPSEPSSS